MGGDKDEVPSQSQKDLKQKSQNGSDVQSVDGAQGANQSKDSTSSSSHADDQSQNRPPLPPRPPTLLGVAEKKSIAPLTPQRNVSGKRPQLISTPTTALSRTDVQTQSHHDDSPATLVTGQETPASSERSSRQYASIKKYKGLYDSDGGDTASLRSYVPASDAGADGESLIGDILGSGNKIPLWKLFYEALEDSSESSDLFDDQAQETADFYHEFDAIFSDPDMHNAEQHMLAQWTAKRKHFLILSSAGKPIYSRHGNDSVIASAMGTIQTIISFFEDSQDHLRSFRSASTRFAIMSQGPLNLLAISKLKESDTQLRAQLEALYMQILSTLTLPTLKTLFTNRPSTDLRRPLKGTEVLLSSLADAFTRGSPSALLSSLECLRLRKSDRKVIEDTLLRNRCSDLLYGLVVAGGRLVSVVRPRKHSLHAGDLQLIFNMLFEADGIKEGGGENWIPLCLPAFNQNGYLYMYVSFVPTLESQAGEGDDQGPPLRKDRDETVILLLSSNRESFHELRRMRDQVVSELERQGSLRLIRQALAAGRPSIIDIVPGSVARHFLYKSKANVQFVMPSYEPHYPNMLARRRLLSVYHQLQASAHAKNMHLHVKHCVGRTYMALAWITPIFELYCVASPHASRIALAQSANKIVQWLQREEQRVFIVGGGVF